MRQSVHDEYRGHSAHWWFRARHTIFARMLDRFALPAGAGARILEVGPGSGVNLPILSPRGRVVVLDHDLGSARACRDDGADAVVRADAAAPPFAPASFDLVCALDVLEHLDDDGRALAAWRALLAPAGILLLSVPAFPCLWGRQDVLSQHKRRYRRRELVAKLAGAGFAVKRATYFNTLLFPPILLARLLMRPFLARSVARGRSDLSVRAPLGLDTLLYHLFAAEARWLPRHDLPVGVSVLAIAQPCAPVPARQKPAGSPAAAR